MEMVVTTGAIGRAKLQSSHHHQQTNIKLFHRPDDALPVAQPTVYVRALKGKTKSLLNIIENHFLIFSR